MAETPVAPTATYARTERVYRWATVAMFGAVGVRILGMLVGVGAEPGTRAGFAADTVMLVGALVAFGCYVYLDSH